MDGESPLEIVCDECGFREIAEATDGRPGDIVLGHGRKTGHKVAVSRL